MIMERSSFFDADWYTSTYPDVPSSGLDPFHHYLWLGARLARSPNPMFDAQWYLRRYPQVLEHGMDPAFHYLKWGRAEGRKIRAVGKAAPYYEGRGRSRHIERRIAEWDAEREGNFLGLVSRRYSEDTTRYDQIPVCIVMPTYNRAHCILNAINSVLAQTHVCWKLVISDDGSDDETEELVRSIEDSRIVYIKGQRAGVSAARNAALAKCDGEYTFYLDTDNTWLPDFVRTMLVFMEFGGLDAAYSAALCFPGAGKRPYTRGDDFEWSACLKQNYVDMNCFAHRTDLIEKHGTFDQSLTRLVDWDLILRYTRRCRAAFAPFIGVHYDDYPKLDRITLSEYASKQQLDDAMQRIRAKHEGFDADETRRLAIRPMAEGAMQRRFVPAVVEALLEEVEVIPSSDPLRIGYVLWDWPALSQTFVLTEIRSLCERGFDVKVYYRVWADQPADVNFPVDAYQVAGEDELLALCKAHQRTCLHSPFVYPAATLMTWPVAEQLGVPFTLMAGGVDVAHYENIKRNRVGEMASSELCLGVVTLGSFHRDLLLECGVPSHKLILERQSVDLPAAPLPRGDQRGKRVLCVARFIEKKGIEYLIQAAARIPDAEFIVHGYGPLRTQYEKLIAELGLVNFTIGEPLNAREQLLAAYEAADVFALPCVRAANGDLDGLPTVLLETMALGLPVVTSDIANTPDLVVDGVTGYLCQPGDVDSLVAALRRSLDAGESEIRSMSELAIRRAHGYAGLGRTVDALLARWRRRPIDIFLVTFDVPGYENVQDTIEIIRRIYRFTVMDFNVYVADNNSSVSFKDALRREFGALPNFHFVELEENLFCGPASNKAIAAGQSEYAIYLCSKEGFILRHGWELQMVRAMDADPDAALGGYLVELPGYRKLGQLTGYPSFASWRSQEYARQYPEAGFKHVQGGIFILRRSAYEAHGGFSDVVVHNGMDVEYSYYLQSKGCRLIDISGVAAVTVKTLPQLRSLVDEHTFVVHPSSKADVPILDGIVGRKHRHCNLCGWHGSSFVRSNADSGEACPQCLASSFDRTAYRVLSQSGFLQTRPKVVGVVKTDALARAMSIVCPRQQLSMLGAADSLCPMLKAAESGSLLIADHVEWQDPVGDAPEAVRLLERHILGGGALLLADVETPFVRALVDGVRASTGLVTRITLVSDASRFDTRAVHFFYGVPLSADLQGIDG